MNRNTTDNARGTLSPRQTLLWIVLPMLASVIGFRLKLHLVGIQHFYLGGHIVRHLFLGVVLVITAGFVLAFVPRRRWLAKVATAVLGIGSGLVLDEIVFLVATNASKEDYVSHLSLGGSIVFVSLAVVLVLVIYMLSRD